jgi:predicted DNA-binding ribbon-helix-helix protein
MNFIDRTDMANSVTMPPNAAPPDRGAFPHAAPQRAPVRALTTRTRTLQFRKKRTSIRLEEVFWEYLEEVAKIEKRQLGPLIGRMSRDYVSGNLTAYLRGVCMPDCLARLAFGSMEGSSLKKASKKEVPSSEVLHVFHLTPCPGVLLSAQATILDCNASVLNWLGRERRTLVGADLGSLLRLQMGQSFARFWDGLVSGQTELSVRQALVLLPGKLTATEISFIRLQRRAEAPPNYIAWFAPPKAAARVPALGA